MLVILSTNACYCANKCTEKYYKIYIKIAPTCFGVLTPFSGSLQVVSGKVMNYQNDELKYHTITLADTTCKLPQDAVRTVKI
jgi:hypothetical protein